MPLKNELMRRLNMIHPVIQAPLAHHDRAALELVCYADLEAAGYSGWVGLEYKPSGASADSFGWIENKESNA